jgi:sugar phosphate isomerase/epimerase
VRIGVDSYSYHRLLGELRPGEIATDVRLTNGGIGVLDEAQNLGIDGVALQTCFLEAPGDLDVGGLRAAAEAIGVELALSWGAPNGIEFGSNRAALSEMLAWIEVAAQLGSRTMRIVVGGPALASQSDRWPRAVGPLRLAAAHADARGVSLAVENHGDLSAHQICDLVDAVDNDALGVCFDTANCLRVGDAVVEAATLLAPLIRMLHLKDVESLANVTNPVAGPRSVAYGTGVIPVAAVLRAVDAQRFGGLVCVEVGQLAVGTDERAFVRASVNWLRDHAAAEASSGKSLEAYEPAG